MTNDNLKGLSERGPSVRTDAFNQASRAAALRKVPEHLHDDAMKILNESDAERALLRERHDRNFEARVNIAYQYFLAHAENRGPALRPRNVSSNRRAELLDAARKSVEAQHARNLARVTVVEKRRIAELTRPSREFGRVAAQGCKSKDTARTAGFNKASRADALRGVPVALRDDAMKILNQSDQERRKLRKAFLRNREPLIDRLHQKLRGANDAKAGETKPAAVFVDDDSRLRKRASRIVDRQQAERLAGVTVNETKQLRELVRPHVEFTRTAEPKVGRGR